MCVASIYVCVTAEQRSKMVSYLLLMGANPSALDKDSLSPIHHVSKSGNTGNLLSEAGSSLELILHTLNGHLSAGLFWQSCTFCGCLLFKNRARERI